MIVNIDLNLILTENAASCMPISPVQTLQIRNNGDTLEQLTLLITSSSQALIPLSLELDRLEAGEPLDIPLAQQLRLNTEYLRHLCHGLTTEIVITVLQAGEMIAGTAKQITLGGVNNHEKRET